MTAPITVPDHRFVARLEPIDQREPAPAPRAGSWFITHPLGRPAGNTYTEVSFTPTVLAALHGLPLDPQLDLAAYVRAILDAVVRAVAVELYGTAWAFTYGPEHPPQSLARREAGRRELVTVEVVEVLS